MYDEGIRSRFWNKVKRGRADECWPWTAAKIWAGYGRFYLERRDGKKRYVTASRLAWELGNDCPIPEGLHVLHKCDNPECCNPKHLELGTHAQNMRQMHERGRASTDHGVRGEDASWSKITEEDARQIKRRLAQGEPVARIAEDFPISRMGIYHIKNGRNWAHVEP